MKVFVYNITKNNGSFVYYIEVVYDNFYKFETLTKLRVDISEYFETFFDTVEEPCLINDCDTKYYNSNDFHVESSKEHSEVFNFLFSLDNNKEMKNIIDKHIHESFNSYIIRFNKDNIILPKLMNKQDVYIKEIGGCGTGIFSVYIPYGKYKKEIFNLKMFSKFL